MIARESHFNPQAGSSRGAHGLMQLTPQALQDMKDGPIYARFFGNSDYGTDPSTLTPEQNIQAGINYLFGLYSTIGSTQGDWFRSLSRSTRWALAVAAYNGGIGAILNAIARCKPQCTTINEVMESYCELYPSACAETVKYVGDVMEGFYNNPVDGESRLGDIILHLYHYCRDRVCNLPTIRR